MEKNTVLLFKSSPQSPSALQHSPGNNPFDNLLKKAIDTATMSEWKNRRSSVQLSENYPDIGRQSVSSCELSDFGRESIGILPPDFGRDSLGFMNISSSEIGRESLGILHINTLRDSLSFRRESIGILNLTDFGRETVDYGRESLGILHVKSPDVKFGDEDKKIPDIILTTIEENSDFACGPLDIAFLHSRSRKSSATSSTTSSITPSFNSYSLEGPSAIYSSPTIKNQDHKSDLLNRGFINGDESSNSMVSCLSSIHSPLNNSKLFNRSDLFNIRTRIRSLPLTIEENCELSMGVTDFEFTQRKFWTTERTMKMMTLERPSFHGTLDFQDTSNEFQDSVFIEGHHIAEKIADGSILNDSSGSDIGILDCTPQPNWPDELSYNEKDVKCDTEKIFKAVDKMLPPSTYDNNIKLKTYKTNSNSSNEKEEKLNTSSNSKSSQNSEKDDSKLIQNISNIPHDSDKYSASHRSRSVSKDAKDILHNLSEILNCTHRSDQQKSEGQNLLSSLANILCENNSNTKPDDHDDSGHSSINEQGESPKNENHECFEVLDLRTKSGSEDNSKNEPTNKNVALDLSLKSKSKRHVDQRLTQSFASKKNVPLNILGKKNNSPLSLDINKNKSRSVNSSVNSNDSKNISNASRVSIAGKLRQKNISHNTKKGPLKAVLPVGDMKKRGSSVIITPERTEQKSTMQSKRTSTPINEPKLRPMAASTPTTRSDKDRKDVPSSALQRLKKIEARKDKVTTPTSSLPRALNMESKLFRRNSVSEIKKVEAVGRTKRSNSVESEAGIMSSLAKVRQNIINSPYYQLKKSTLKENNSIGTENTAKCNKNKGTPINKTSHSDKEKNSRNGPLVNYQFTTKSLSKLKNTRSSNVEKDKNGNLISTKLPIRCNDFVAERRHSLSDIKSLRENSLKLKRSKSFKNETGIMSSLSKIRQNILNSPFYLKNDDFTSISSDTSTNVILN